MLNTLTNDELFRYIQQYGPMTAMEAELMTRFEELLEQTDISGPIMAVLDNYGLSSDDPKELETGIDKLQTEISNLRDQLETTEEENLRLDDALEAAKQEIDSLHAELDELDPR